MRLSPGQRHHISSQRGDTIVEVLISIAIVSLVLGGAFVATNRSLAATRAAQERGDALKLVESQIEQIKGLVDTDPDELFGASTPASYCISSGAAVLSSTAPCRVSASGVATTSDPSYSLAITRSGNTFTIRNTWATQKNTTDVVQMKYKAYQ